MNKGTLLGILAGCVCLSVACLCAPWSLLSRFATPIPTPIRVVPASTYTWSPAELTNTSPATATFTETPTVQINPVCVSDLTDELHASENAVHNGKKLERNFYLISYAVTGDEISDPVYEDSIPVELKPFQEDTAMHERMWQFFTNIIPADRRTEVTRFIVFTDGPSNSLGAVERGSTPHDWTLEMDIQDGTAFADLSSTLVHEFAHLLSLNDTEVTPNLDVFNNPNDRQIYNNAAAQCPNFFAFEGCSKTDSYINQFFQYFWSGIYDDWLAIDSEASQSDYERLLNDFYWEHKSQFVSSYAVTSPEEDFAETFMYYIFTTKPSGEDTSQQKILFLYSYPELVTLRNEILSHLCTYVVKP